VCALRAHSYMFLCSLANALGRHHIPMLQVIARALRRQVAVLFTLVAAASRPTRAQTLLAREPDAPDTLIRESTREAPQVVMQAPVFYSPRTNFVERLRPALRTGPDRPRRAHVIIGAVAGGAVGVFAGVRQGIHVDRSCGRDTRCRSYSPIAIRDGIVFGALGAAIGGTVGWFWH
jgi:hypothetical protein